MYFERRINTFFKILPSIESFKASRDANKGKKENVVTVSLSRVKLLVLACSERVLLTVYTQRALRVSPVWSCT